jgi:hypothetical protein
MTPFRHKNRLADASVNDGRGSKDASLLNYAGHTICQASNEAAQPMLREAALLAFFCYIYLSKYVPNNCINCKFRSLM